MRPRRRVDLRRRKRHVEFERLEDVGAGAGEDGHAVRRRPVLTLEPRERALGVGVEALARRRPAAVRL